MSAAGLAVPAVAARIGPNAITRMAEALRAAAGEAVARRVFATAALEHLYARPPEDMVDEADVARLHRSAHEDLGVTFAAAVARDAGLRTADYLLAHRIPRPVQGVLRPLPAGLAARLLVGAIRRHAWTFAGSGHFSARWRRGGVALVVAGCPLCRELDSRHPVCDFYAATFERLFRELVHPDTFVRETACEAVGDEACVFEVNW